MANQFPDEDAKVMGVPINWEVEIPLEQKATFAELLRGLATLIAPGNSLKEVCVIADGALASKIQLLTGKPYQSGPHHPEGAAVPVEQGNTFFSKILIRRAFFTSGQIEQISTLVEELYHCQLYHQTWQRRGYINPHFTDLYACDLFTICEQVHDEYAVARLKNRYFGENFSWLDEQGQPIPFFVEYGSSLAASFDQVPDQVRARDILQSAPSMRKRAMLPSAYRFIFEPLARHAGFLTPITPNFPLRDPDNIPEGSAFYREVIAPYWIPIKSALEASFDSQFSRTEEALQAMSEMVDACLDRLRQEYAI